MKKQKEENYNEENPTTTAKTQNVEERKEITIHDDVERIGADVAAEESQTASNRREKQREKMGL